MSVNGAQTRVLHACVKKKNVPHWLLCDITSNFKDFTKFGVKIREVDATHFKSLFFKFLYAFQDQSYARSK